MTYLDHLDLQFRYHWASTAWTPWARYTPWTRMMQAIIIAEVLSGTTFN